MRRRALPLAISLLMLVPANALARAGGGSHGFSGRSPSFGGGSRGGGFGGGHHFFFFGGGGGGGGGFLLIIIIVLVVLFVMSRRGRRPRP